MARYTGPRCRICRRHQAKLFLKGARCLTEKCSFERRAYPPGLTGQEYLRKKVSDYGLQLREKQKLRAMYGVLEKQFRGYFRRAEQSTGITGENLLILLERRLDNVIYRIGSAASRAHARQIVRHNKVKVNGKKLNIPSYLVRAGDTIELKEGEIKKDDLPTWLEKDGDKVKVAKIPERSEISIPIDENLIVAFYSK
jgi:small subunit ribosomal protein S4